MYKNLLALNSWRLYPLIRYILKVLLLTDRYKTVESKADKDCSSFFQFHFQILKEHKILNQHRMYLYTKMTISLKLLTSDCLLFLHSLRFV